MTKEEIADILLKTGWAQDAAMRTGHTSECVASAIAAQFDVNDLSRQLDVSDTKREAAAFLVARALKRAAEQYV